MDKKHIFYFISEDKPRIYAHLKTEVKEQTIGQN